MTKQISARSSAGLCALSHCEAPPSPINYYHLASTTTQNPTLSRRHTVCLLRYLMRYQAFKWGFSGGSAGKESACNVGDLGSIPGLGRSSGERNGLPTPVSWPGEFHGLHRPWGHKEMDTTGWLSPSLFPGLATLFPLGLRQLTFPPTVCSASLPVLSVSCPFDDSHPNRCEMRLHCGFDFYFPDD